MTHCTACNPNLPFNSFNLSPVRYTMCYAPKASTIRTHVHPLIAPGFVFEYKLRWQGFVNPVLMFRNNSKKLCRLQIPILYWKEKETHIHFGCYLNQRCSNCETESLFEMLNIHICTRCYTFLCKNTTCVSHVNGKVYRGYEGEIQAVLNNRKNWFLKCSGFG